MEGSFMAASFQTPAVDPATSYSSRYPTWVLLDKRAYFADRDNATTARAKMSTGHDVKVTFCRADPPAVSHFCVHCPQIHREDYTTEPLVVSSAKDLALLSFAFRTGPRSRIQDSNLLEYFVYKAAASSAGNPFIRPVPYSPPGTRHSPRASIVPRDGGNFFVADLSPRGDLGQYDLLVFLSETNEWRTTRLKLSTPANVLPRDLPSVTDKVIWLRGSTVGWVDLWRGIVFCDVLQKEPVLSFIPLPTTAFDLHRAGQAQRAGADLPCCNGYISFVEIEHCLRELVHRRSFKMTQNLDTEDVILDKACLLHHGDLGHKPELVPDGWKIRTMFKGITWDYGKKRHTVHVDEISSAIPERSVMLPRVWNGGAMKWTPRSLKSFPFYSVYGDNVVYLMSKLESDDQDSWIVGVDLEKKKLEVIQPYCAAGGAGSSDPTFLPCTFSEYMNTTPRHAFYSGRINFVLLLTNFHAHLKRIYQTNFAESYSRNVVPKNHLPLGDTIPIAAANSTQNVVPNDHLSSGYTSPTANCDQNGVPNDHLTSRYNVPDNVQPQQNMWSNGDGYHGRWNGYGYGAHPGYGHYQQPTPFQPQFIPPPNLPPPVQPMLSPTPTWVSGYIYASWTDTDANGQMLMTVPLNDMLKLTPLTPPMPPMAAPSSSTSKEIILPTTGDFDGQPHHMN
ncbi:hypothetical protein ACQ4PT_055158 [Festuca glaucescens]